MMIEEVSKECHVPTATLRYWEETGLLPPISRDENGYRNYEKRDLNWVLYVKALRHAGMEVHNLKKFIDSYRATDSRSERKQILIDQQTALIEQLNKIKETLDYLDFKIDNFDQHMIGYEEEKLATETMQSEEQ